MERGPRELGSLDCGALAGRVFGLGDCRARFFAPVPGRGGSVVPQTGAELSSWHPGNGTLRFLEKTLLPLKI